MSFYLNIIRDRFQLNGALNACLIVVVLSITAVGCATQHLEDSAIITVEGMVTVRGNVPFNAVILETDGHNLYILKMDAATRDALTTPAMIRVRGRLYLDTWNALPFAHLEVIHLERQDAE